MKTFEELQIECARLQRENTYLRHLLNLDSDTPLVIPEDKPIEPFPCFPCQDNKYE